jgi:integrase
MWSVAGKRLAKSFPTYSAAKAHADELLPELYKGSQVTLLSPDKARDAIAALERLQAYFQATGKRVSLLSAVSQFAESSALLPHGVTLSQSTEGFLGTVASVKRKDISEAVEDFIAHRKLKTVAKDRKRPQLSPEHHYNTGQFLRGFAKAFPNHAVCDLTKGHMDKYFAQFATSAPKTRNERRGIVKMLLNWCLQQDYLSRTHRLLEATQMRHENSDPEVVELYTADELQAMLDRASKEPAKPKAGEQPQADYRELFPVIALAGLAGLRFKEILRLNWSDVFRVPEHIEVTAGKSKTRSRRLVQIVPALAQWLEDYHQHAGPIWSLSYDRVHEIFGELREELSIPNRRNGLRHSFISAHFAVYSDEGLTAKEAGNSPEMLHKNYKGLLTKKQGEAWLTAAPAKPVNVVSLSAWNKK